MALECSYRESAEGPLKAAQKSNRNAA